MPDLISLADLKQRLGIPSANINADADLSALITQTSADFHRQVNRASVLTAEYNEQRNGCGTQTLLLRNDPVVSVAGLAISGISIPPSDGQQPGYIIDGASLRLNGYTFREGWGNVTVQYTAGFGATPDDIPQDIVLAVLDWCHHRYVARPGMGMATRHLASGEAVGYDQRTMPDSVAATIQRYKRRA
jgi:hypothetical protein